MKRFFSAGGGKQVQGFRGVVCLHEFKLWEHGRMAYSVTKRSQNPWLLDRADRAQTSCRNQPDAVVSHMASYVRQNRVVIHEPGKILLCLPLPYLSWFPRTEIASCEQKQVQSWDTGHNHKNLMFTAWFQCQFSFCSQNSDITSSGEVTSAQLSSLPLHSRVVPSLMSQRENSSRITLSLETRPGTSW